MNAPLRLHRFLPETEAEGPGVRACLWVQGCPIRCAGCAVPWTWDAAGGQEIWVSDLARRILDNPRIEGVTFLGGEPFAQAGALALLARQIKSAGLSVMTFSGYTLEHLRASQRQDWDALLAQTDLLIDGPFVQEQVDFSRPWVGSKNQRYHFLSERYRHLEGQLHRLPNRLEARILPDGTLQLNGMASQAMLKSLADRLSAKT